MTDSYWEYREIERREVRDWLDTLSTKEIVNAYNEFRMSYGEYDSLLYTYTDNGNNVYCFFANGSELELIEDVTDYENLFEDTESYYNWLDDIARCPKQYNYKGE